MRRLGIVLALAVLCNAFAQVETAASRKPSITMNGNVLIKGGRVLTVTKGAFDDTDVLVLGGKIAKIGKNLETPPNVQVINAKGRVVMPGIVDAHIHRGIDATNEGTDSITAECRIADVLNPTSKNIWQALAGGETTGLALHGSANCIGGESKVIKLKYNRSVAELIVPDAPRMIKFALGENVTRSGQTSQPGPNGTTAPQRYPRTRMGVQTVYRRAFTEAREYMEAWDKWNQTKSGKMPRRDVRLDTLADILRGRVWVECHSYRADEMLMMVRLSQEFGFKLGALQHALEAYKIAPELAKAGVGVSIFIDNWSFKIEGYDAIPYNAAICTNAGVTVSANTDGIGGMPSLALDAAKTMRFGGLSEDQALALLTINGAKLIGIDHRTGSLEVGKDGDITIWDGHPLSPYSRCAYSLIEGEVFFERRDMFGVDSRMPLPQTLPENRQTKPMNLPTSGDYAITNATVHTMSGPVLQKGTVVIRDGKIAAVGTDVSVPGGVHRVDAKGMHLYPGFIDAGNSIGLSEISPIGQTVDANELGTFQPDLIAQTAINVQSEHFPVARCGGVLTSLSRPGGGTVCGQASLVNHFGWTGEQMGLGRQFLVVSFPGGGGGGFEEDDFCEVLGGEMVKHHEETLEEILQGTSELDRYFDKATEYLKGAKVPKELSLEAMRPYIEGTAPIVFKVRNKTSIERALAFIDKYKVKGILSGAADAWKLADELARRKIPVILNPAGKSTLASNAPVSDFDPYDAPFATPYLLKKAGVKFCFATEDNSGAFNLPIRAATSCAYGLTMDDCLKAMTLDAADILGVGDRLGSVDTGKVANLVLCDGDPCAMTSNIVAIWVNGTAVPLESKFTRLRDQWSKRKN
ncbi:MAG: amidohydrolase family protein [Fimbriimonadaceae bacterium]